MTRLALKRQLALLLFSLVAVAPVAGAQVDQQLWRWVDAQGGFCLWYLSDPAIAPELVPDGMELGTAKTTGGLPTVLMQIVQDEPRFGNWVPGVVCVGRFAAVASDGIPAGTMDDGKPILITLAALAAAAPLGQNADWYLLDIGLDAGHLDRIASDARIRTRGSDFRVRKGLPGENEQWELRMDGIRLAWQGYPTDSVRVARTRSMSFGYAGNRNSVWTVDLMMAPASEQLQIGSLRVEGNTALASALKSSPIRTMGALSSGGEMTLSFTRDTTLNR